MQPYKWFFHEYNVTYRPYLNQLNQELAEFHLYSSQWRIMHFILHYGEKTMSEITHYQKVEKPTTTKMVQRLIDLDYLEAKQGTDRRTKLLALTEKGKEVSAQVQKKISEFQYRLLEGIPEEDQVVGARILRHIAETLEQHE